MMMVASLVVRSGCGTPLWLRGGKGGGVVFILVGVGVGEVVIDIEKNVENRGAVVMVLKFSVMTINRQWTEV